MSTEEIDKDIEITLDDVAKLGGKKSDTGDTNVEVAKAGEEGAAAKPPVTADEGKEDLAKQLEAMKATADAERSARQKAEGEATEARKAADAARRESGSHQEQLVTQAIDKVTGDAAAAKNDLRVALERADYEAVANAQEAIARAAARLTNLEAIKSEMDVRKARTPAPATHEGRVEKAAATENADPFEKAISGLSTSSQAWARQHPTCFTDQKLYSKTLSAHHAALAEDIQPDTPQYFTFLEEKLGFREPPKKADEGGQAQQRTALRTAAPPDRGGGSTPSSRLVGNKITLTPAEREAAAIAGMSEQEYAVQLIKAERQGELGKYAQR